MREGKQKMLSNQTRCYDWKKKVSLETHRASPLTQYQDSYVLVWKYIWLVPRHWFPLLLHIHNNLLTLVCTFHFFSFFLQQQIILMNLCNCFWHPWHYIYFPICISNKSQNLHNEDEEYAQPDDDLNYCLNILGPMCILLVVGRLWLNRW